MTTKDFHQVHLKPHEAYLYFLANKETDTTLLPHPKTEVQQKMYNDCVTAATALLEAAAAAAEAAASGSGSGGSGTTG